MNEAPSQPVAGNNAPRRRFFVAGICLFAFWVAGLVTLVVTSSNPVTLNVAQLKEADCVVVAKLSDADAGEFTLVSTIKGVAPETFRVLTTAEITSPESENWLLPLYQERAGTSVVPVPYRDREPLLVYPATDDVVAEMRKLVGPIVD